MAVPLTGDGGFFTRQGAIVGEYNRVGGVFYGSALDAGFLAIWLQFVSSDQAAVQDLPNAVAAFRGSNTQYLSVLQQDGQLATTLQVNDDTPVVPYTVPQALSILAAQMRANNESVNRPTLGSSVTPGASNLGDTTVVVSTTNKYGDPSDMTFAETVTVTCTAATGGTSFGATLQAVGEPTVAASSSLWPAGSGANVSFSVADGATTTLVTQGALTNWTNTNTPTGWEVSDGDFGVQIFQSAGGGFRAGTNAAELRSDGASLTELVQDITLSTNTVYAFGLFVRRSVSNANGTFRVRLTDGNGTTIADDAGTDLAYLTTINGLADTFGLVSAMFSTPRQLPEVVQFRFGFSTAPTATRGVIVCLAALVAATPLYSQGPYMAAFSGDSRTAVGDTFAAAFTNSLDADSFVRGMDRVYSVRNMVDSAGNQVYLPSDSSPTVPDSLVLN